LAHVAGSGIIAGVNIPLRQYWNLIVRYIVPQRLPALGLVLLLLAGIALQVVNPQIMRLFLDTAQAGGSTAGLIHLALIFLVVALVQQGAIVGATYLGENVAWTATNMLRAELADHCLRLDMYFHNAHTPGEMIERIDGDVTALSNFFSQFFIQVIGNGILLLGVVALLLVEDWRVGLVVGTVALSALAVLARLRNVAVSHWRAQRQASADLFGFLEERLAGTEEIRANGAEIHVMRGFYVRMRELLNKSLKAGLMVNLMLNSSIMLFALATAAAFAVGARLYYAGALTIGAVYIVFHYTRMLEQPINQIVRQLQDLQRAGASIVREQELLAVESGLPEVSAGPVLPDGPLAVLFDGVSFSYHDTLPAPGSLADDGNDQATAEAAVSTSEPVLCNVRFSLAPGRVLGLLGRTGSGKTTVTRLLFRLYDPDAGAVCLPLQGLRRRVGLVTQNIQLFHATVRDNLTFFDRTISDRRILEVLEDLGLEEWVRGLPAGLDTVLDSGGGGLSAGEAQLLAFTRIFLQDPGLVILDEASSRLDPATERLVENAVGRLLENRTAIIIAHRLGTVQRADEILILDGGQVEEVGVRAELACDPGSRFAELLRTGMEGVLV
jgi:ATP-binding cassette subfamily B protein